jgi:hypothetical protein
MKNLFLGIILISLVLTSKAEISITPTNHDTWFILMIEDTCILLPLKITKGCTFTLAHDELTRISFFAAPCEEQCIDWAHLHDIKLCTETELYQSFSKVNERPIKGIWISIKNKNHEKIFAFNGRKLGCFDAS